MGHDALKQAVPFVPLISSLFSFIPQIHPQSICDKSVNENFVIRESKERTGQIVDLYLKKRVVLMNNVSESALHLLLKDAKMLHDPKFLEQVVETLTVDKELHAKIIQKLKSQIVEHCHETRKKVVKIAESFGIKKVDFSFAIPNKADHESPYSAFGNPFSFVSSPFISCCPPTRTIFVDPAITSMEIPADYTTPELEFILAHEIVHIAKSHGLISAICSLAFSIFTSALWFSVLKECLVGKLTIGFIIPKILGILGTAFASQLFEHTLDRCHEQEADCEAIDYLQSNLGGVAFFEKNEKKESSSLDLRHPPLLTRLEYCRSLGSSSQ